MTPLLGKATNAVLFQAAWFAAVLGAARGYFWLGPLAMLPVLALHLARCDNRRGELRLLSAAGLLGFVFDSVLVRFGIILPLAHLFPRPFSPPWMICLWVNFAITLNVSLSWLGGRYLLASFFGALGGPLAYYSAGKLGATEALPTGRGMLVLALGWAVMTPLLVWLARRSVHPAGPFNPPPGGL